MISYQLGVDFDQKAPPTPTPPTPPTLLYGRNFHVKGAFSVAGGFCRNIAFSSTQSGGVGLIEEEVPLLLKACRVFTSGGGGSIEPPKTGGFRKRA